jgi:hypothetical protein
MHLRLWWSVGMYSASLRLQCWSAFIVPFVECWDVHWDVGVGMRGGVHLTSIDCMLRALTGN